ncbi:MAG: hypothetical protein Q9193_002681 [Seirophora villosa]
MLPPPPSRRPNKSTDTSAQDESDPNWHLPSSRKKRTESSNPRKPASKDSAFKTPSRAEQRNLGSQSPVLTSTGRKRKSSGGRTSDSSLKEDGHDSGSGFSGSPRKISRPRKAQKLGGSSAPPSDEAIPERSSMEPSKGFYGAPVSKQTSVPPVPPLPASFDPAKVDKEKLLALRSIPKDSLPFGCHLDDIVNLQKEFPHCGQKDLDQYLSSLRQHHDAKARPCNTENANPATPFSEQGRSSSPTKALKEDDSAPHAGNNISPKRRMVRELSTIEEAITVDPSKDKSIPPMPTDLKKKAQVTFSTSGKKGKTMDKALSNIQKESYDWPDDVF